MILYRVTAPKHVLTNCKSYKIEQHGTDYSIRSSDVLNSLERSNLEEKRKRHLLVTMFKVFNTNCPTYLRERFHRTSEIHDYNLRGSNYDLQLPLPKTNFLKVTPNLRGCLPEKNSHARCFLGKHHNLYIDKKLI